MNSSKLSMKSFTIHKMGIIRLTSWDRYIHDTQCEFFILGKYLRILACYKCKEKDKYEYFLKTQIYVKNIYNRNMSNIFYLTFPFYSLKKR